MVALNTTLDRYDHAYNALSNYFWIEMFTDHQPYLGTCVIYDIPNEDFLENFICMFSRPVFIWRIMIDALMTPLVVIFDKFCGPHLLHLEEDLFNDVTITHLLSINLWCWDFMLFIFVSHYSAQWAIDHTINTHYHFHPFTHDNLLQILAQLGNP